MTIMLILNLTVELSAYAFFLYTYYETKTVWDEESYMHELKTGWLALVGASTVLFFFAIIAFSAVFCKNPGYTENIDTAKFTQHLDRAIKEERNLDYFCFFCRNLWSSSTVHCMTCGKCVEGFDHHCPFINNCIGYKNHGSFLTFLFTTLFYIMVQIALLICTLVRRYKICLHA